VTLDEVAEALLSMSCNGGRRVWVRRGHLRVPFDSRMLRFDANNEVVIDCEDYLS
jgi:hypothetical protein